MDKNNFDWEKNEKTSFAEVILTLAILAALIVSALLVHRVWTRQHPSPAAHAAEVRRFEEALYWQRKHPDEFAAMRRAARAHANDTILDTP